MWDYKYRLTTLSHFSAVMWDVGTASRCVALMLLTVNELTQVIDWGAPLAVTLLVSWSSLRGFPPSQLSCWVSKIVPSSDTSQVFIVHSIKNLIDREIFHFKKRKRVLGPAQCVPNVKQPLKSLLQFINVTLLIGMKN